MRIRMVVPGRTMPLKRQARPSRRAGSPAASRLSARDLEILDAAAQDLKDHPGAGLIVVLPGVQTQLGGHQNA